MALDPEHVRPFVGDYALSEHRQVALGLNSDPAWGGPYFFYAEGDRLVRLHPVSRSVLLSERGEEVTLRRGPDNVPGLLWQRRGEAVPAQHQAIYRTEDVAFRSAGATLVGTLLLPQGQGPHAAVVLVHGSLPAFRDFYRIWAEPFTRAGIAALVYDKRGFGESTGNADSSIAERATDAEAALTYLQHRADIDPARVGLWGFSNGTWSIPIVAARRPDVAFLIALGAVGVSPAEAELHRKLFELREWGAAEHTLRQVAHAWDIIYRYAATGKWDARWNEDFASLVDDLKQSDALQHIPLPQYAIDAPWLSPIPPLISTQALKVDYRGVAPDMGADPASAYAHVHCPVLFLIGEHDGNVPVAESVRRVTQALEEAGNRDHTIQVVPSAGHLLNIVGPPITGMSTEEASYRLHRFCFAPGVMDRMVGWAAERGNTGT